VGEYLAAQQLRELGWGLLDAEVFGGLRRHFDLRAVAPGGGRSVQVSVKTSTRADGGIAWQKPGVAGGGVDRAAGAAGEQAIVLGLHVEPVAAVQPVPGGFFFPTPRVIEVGVLAARDWGREVDAQRAAYGARMRTDGRRRLSPGWCKSVGAS
jgi:hypothetical protein